jgi:hypothetical protein
MKAADEQPRVQRAQASACPQARSRWTQYERVTITVPPGRQPGSRVVVQAGGKVVTAIVPEDALPGDVFEVDIPLDLNKKERLQRVPRQVVTWLAQEDGPARKAGRWTGQHLEKLTLAVLRKVPVVSTIVHKVEHRQAQRRAQQDHSQQHFQTPGGHHQQSSVRSARRSRVGPADERHTTPRDREADAAAEDSFDQLASSPREDTGTGAPTLGPPPGGGDDKFALFDDEPLSPPAQATAAATTLFDFFGEPEPEVQVSQP